VNYLIVRDGIVENVCVVEESEVDSLAALLGCELVPVDDVDSDDGILLGDEHPASTDSGRKGWPAIRIVVAR